jgi:hypothetical protein
MRRWCFFIQAFCRKLAGGVPFAMEPVVYDFAINERGTYSDFLTGEAATLPDKYCDLILPSVLRKDRRSLSTTERSDVERFSSSWRSGPGALDVRRAFSIACCRETRRRENRTTGLAAHGEWLRSGSA